MKISILPAYGYHQEISTLFSEYTQTLIEGNHLFADYLSLQNFNEELNHLDVKYGLPWGRLYLAICDGQPAGCIGLRKLDEHNCEMKRLYVRPQFRGNHIGETLIQQIIHDAKIIGYSFMLLDTFHFLKSAIHMYQSYGFYEIERYNENPIEGCIYMKLNL